ncbi:hypothetical protein TUM19329_08130 [Legionella antarctica]|uniref:Coiled coil protein n=2 Tax=Legionella antarctica TaxID=2708020 RepID=A0A6F8T354_9GAMM|nr:hypothetical protein TUM19329_08130 [Legionella antarctica]
MNIDQVRLIIDPMINSLSDIKTVNDEIISNARLDIDGGLNELREAEKITLKQYQDMMLQNRDELKLRITAGELIDQQFQRLSNLQAEASTKTQGFNLPNTTSTHDLEKLMALLQIRRAITEDKKEELCLTTLFQTVEACKNHLDEFGSFESKTIPLLKKEEQYVVSLHKQMEHFKLDEPNSKDIERYIKKLEEFRAIQKKYLNDPNISEDEEQIMQQLYRNISVTSIKVIDDLIMGNGGVDDDEFQNEISAHVLTAWKQSQKIEITSGFKGFINAICNVIKLAPIFNITNSSIINKMNDIKNELFLNTEEDSDFEDEDEDDENRRLLERRGP